MGHFFFQFPWNKIPSVISIISHLQDDYLPSSYYGCSFFCLLLFSFACFFFSDSSNCFSAYFALTASSICISTICCQIWWPLGRTSQIWPQVKCIHLWCAIFHSSCTESIFASVLWYAALYKAFIHVLLAFQSAVKCWPKDGIRSLYHEASGWHTFHGSQGHHRSIDPQLNFWSCLWANICLGGIFSH